ncbi:transposase [Lactococcus garvieae]|uniref:transposase n=1 Tax=Lactococcus garvieae TaxID=1363 RepID=UPI0032517969
MVDASFVEVPNQRNPRDENQRRQKDTDARWTKKANINYYGYKDHAKYKFITNYQTPPANVHGSQVCGVLVTAHETVYDDSAYKDQDLPEGTTHKSCERAYQNRPLTEVQKAVNRFYSKTRCHVEHVFGFIENSMNGSTLRSIGFQRVVTSVDLTNLTYNLFRYEQIQRLALKKWEKESA